MKGLTSSCILHTCCASMQATAAERASIEQDLGVVLAAQAGASAWCFIGAESERLRPGERMFVLPLGQPGRRVIIAQDRVAASSSSFRSGGMVWDAGEELACWLCTDEAVDALGAPLSDFGAALELGAGVGLVSVTLALRGVERVVATDGDVGLCELAASNAVRNGVASQMRALPLAWGDGDPTEVVRALGGSSPLILAADCLYDWGPRSSDELERTLRTLIGRGGCRRLCFCWRVRNFREERFLPRLADLGRVRTVWRSRGGDAPPAAGDGDPAFDAWAGRNLGTRVISLLEVESTTPNGQRH